MRAKQHYITGYIQWHYAIYRFSHYTFLFSFSSLAQQLACENPPNKCAKMTRQIILPWKSAGFTRENNPPNLLARKTCHFSSRLACQRSPLPCSKSPGKTRPANPPPPPHGSANGAGGGGREPARPTHAYWTGTFPFFSHLMNGCIFLYNTTYTYSTQSGLNEV